VSAEAEQTGQRGGGVRENAAARNIAVGELRRSVIRLVRTSATEWIDPVSAVTQKT
jgi:hypothetical protein